MCLNGSPWWVPLGPSCDLSDVAKRQPVLCACSCCASTTLQTYGGPPQVTAAMLISDCQASASAQLDHIAMCGVTLHFLRIAIDIAGGAGGELEASARLDYECQVMQQEAAGWWTGSWASLRWQWAVEQGPSLQPSHGLYCTRVDSGAQVPVKLMVASVACCSAANRPLQVPQLHACRVTPDGSLHASVSRRCCPQTSHPHTAHFPTTTLNPVQDAYNAGTKVGKYIGNGCTPAAVHLALAYQAQTRGNEAYVRISRRGPSRLISTRVP